MKRKRFFTRLITAVLLVVLILLGVWNGLHNASFLAVSAVQWISPIITLLISYIGTQWKTDRRSAQSHAENAVRQLREAAAAPEFSRICPDESPADRTVRLEKMQYAVSLLREYGKRFDFAEEVALIEKQFSCYRALFEEHRNDPDYLEKSESLFRRYSDSICRICDRIVLFLHD